MWPSSGNVLDLAAHPSMSKLGHTCHLYLVSSSVLQTVQDTREAPTIGPKTLVCGYLAEQAWCALTVLGVATSSRAGHHKGTDCISVQEHVT